MKHQNFKSDFQTVHTFSEVKDGSAEQIEVPQHVRLTFFTPQRRGCITAERNGDTMNGCSLSDDGMTLTAFVPLSRTFLGEGELICEVAVISDDAGFPGGKRTEVTPVKIGVALWPGETDGGDGVESDIILGIVSDAVAKALAAASSATQAATDAQEAASSAEQTASDAAAEAKSIASTAAEEAKSIASEAAEQAKNIASEAAEQAQATADKAASDAKATAAQAVADAKASTDKLIADTEAAADTLIADTKAATEKAVTDAQTATAQAVSDAKEATDKAVADAKATIDKLTSDVDAAEAARQAAETARQSAESYRQSAETARESAETARQAAEAERVTEYGQFKFDINEGLACIEGHRDLPDWEEDADGGSVRAFNAGEYCKHPWTDPDTGETKSYVFRFLSSVAVGDAWDAEKAVLTSVFGELKEMVIGDTETLVIGVSSSDGLLNVIGVSVIVKNITKGSQQTLVTNDSGIATVQIDKGDIVDIEAAQQSGYQKPGTVRHKATLNTAYVYVVYQKTVETCTVTAHLRNVQGAAVGAGDVIALNLDNAVSLTAEVDANGNAVFEDVPQGHTGTVRVIKHVGYVTPASQSFDTSHASVSLDFLYTEAEVGIFMVKADGTEVLLENWDAEDTLVAVHFNTQELADRGADYYVKPEHLDAAYFTSGEGRSLAWSVANVEYPNVPYDSDTDWDGAGNTAAMLADAQELLTNSRAAEFAVAQSFTLGDRTAMGYIGTKRQAEVLIYNHETVEAMLTAAGFTPNYYPQVIWTSTQYSATYAWIWYRSYWISTNKDFTYSVVPFFAI